MFENFRFGWTWKNNVSLSCSCDNKNTLINKCQTSFFDKNTPFIRPFRRTLVLFKGFGRFTLHSKNKIHGCSTFGPVQRFGGDSHVIHVHVNSLLVYQFLFEINDHVIYFEAELGWAKSKLVFMGHVTISSKSLNWTKSWTPAYDDEFQLWRVFQTLYQVRQVHH